MKNIKKTLFLIGAGPGDPELLTMKACNVIKSAQVILYDNLIDQRILELAPKECIKRYVGKKPYEKCVSQQDIHILIGHYCNIYDSVIRLKGGDPYLFGRGFEEWLYAKKLTVNVEYIPGVSAMMSTGLINIPLTHREVSNGVWALTATKADDQFVSDLYLAAQSNSTIVIYMGMKKLEVIVRAFVVQGKGEMSAAIVQRGSQLGQRHIICRVADLVKVSNEHGFLHPAIVVIGAVVDLQTTVDTVSQSVRELFY